MKKENVEQEICKFHIYPAEYFCPINWKSHKCELTDNTYSIHHFEASWLTEKEKKKKISKKYGLYDSSAEQNMQKYFRKREV